LTPVERGRLTAFQPPLHRVRLWALLLALWSAPAAISAIVVYIRMLEYGGPASWVRALLVAAPFWYLWALLTPLVLLLGHRFRLEGERLWLNVAVHALIAGIMGGAHVFLVCIATRAIDAGESADTLMQEVRYFAEAYFPFEYLIYWAILGAGYLIDYQDRYRTSALRAAHLEAQLAQAHLQALKVQLQPHFLFNTLHAISSLMDEDLEMARRMLVRLGDLLRLTLETQGIQEVSLRQELECMELYLDIERVRFSEHLDVHMLVEPEVIDAMVPNLILQPLVENAVRYGIAPLQHGGRITITARRQNDMLSLRVVDDGAGDGDGAEESFSEARTGVGLANVRSRLVELYGRQHEFRTFRPCDGGFGVELVVPFHPAPIVATG
jgi:two-component system LytT family sensor kinase